jgi:hypothetical protein
MPPNTIELIHSTFERPTMELCGAERSTWRCILSRDHEGDHEALTTTTIHRWSDVPAVP